MLMGLHNVGVGANQRTVVSIFPVLPIRQALGKFCLAGDTVRHREELRHLGSVVTSARNPQVCFHLEYIHSQHVFGNYSRQIRLYNPLQLGIGHNDPSLGANL